MLFNYNLVRSAFIISLMTLHYTSTEAFAAEPGSTSASAISASDTNKQEVVAKVNNRNIYAIDLRRARKVVMSGQPGLQAPPESQKEFDSQALTQLVAAELLYQAGQKLEIKDLEKRVDVKMAQGKAKFPSSQEFDNAIKSLEMTTNDLIEYTRRDLVISNFIEQTIASKILVTSVESKAFYEQNLDKFNRGETIRASHILVGTAPNASGEEKKKARMLSEKLRIDLGGGADFSLLAKEHSTCPSGKQGGDLGFFGKGQMVLPFEQAAFALKPGEMSGVVETQFGFHIIKIMDKKIAETMEFKDVTARIEGYLKSQKTSAAIKTYVVEARKTALIEILLK